MIREDRFLVSRRPYALDLGSFRVRTNPLADIPNARQTYGVRIAAVWFRRRSGVTAAVIGSVWDIMGDPAPADVHEALARMDDGRYGGSWVGRWDGESYAAESPGSPDQAAEHMAILRPMLDNYPAVPEGYDGWWRYPTAAENRAARQAAS